MGGFSGRTAHDRTPAIRGAATALPIAYRRTVQGYALLRAWIAIRIPPVPQMGRKKKLEHLQLLHTQRWAGGFGELARDLIGTACRPCHGPVETVGGNMVIPLRTIVALDEDTSISALIQTLEEAGCEVVTTSSSGGWMLLSRVHPDLLILDPACGGGLVENWRRAVERYRRSRALGLLVVSPSASIRALFSTAADLGVHEGLPPPNRLREIVDGWEEENESMREAS